MMRGPRFVLFLTAAAAAAVIGGAAPTASAVRRLQPPVLRDIGRAPLVLPNAVLEPAGVRRLVAAPRWGGEVTATTGEAVTVFVSDAYPEDPAVAQRWADFLASLVHGPELAQLTAYLAPAAEVEDLCGDEALACYSPRESILVAPGEDPSFDVSAEAVVAHEYGHHVAAHRTNAPWHAIDYGTKRWATHEHVCPRTRRGNLFPGAEDLPRYRFNPGEAFAETYRVLNQRKLGAPETEWQVVSKTLYPDERALALVEQDVLKPWTAQRTSTLGGRTSGAAPLRRYTISTPLDGALRVAVQPSGGVRLALDLVNGRKVVHGAHTVAGTVCGERHIQLRVRRTSGAGSFRLTVSKP